MENTNEVTTVAQAKRGVGRPKDYKVKWPTGAVLLNLFRYNKDRAIADKLGTTVPNVWNLRVRLNKAAVAAGKPGNTYSFVPQGMRSTAKKTESAVEVTQAEEKAIEVVAPVEVAVA